MKNFESVQVSVIVVNYNTKDMTKSCIDSVFKETIGLSFEFILVDNASQDGSIDLFSNDERIKFIANNENSGFGIANNLGLSKSCGKYVFFLNSDTVLLNNAIKYFYDFAEKMQSKLKIGCCGALLLSADLDETYSYGSLPTIRNILEASALRWVTKHFLRSNKYYEDDKIVRKPGFFEVGYVIGADMFVPSSALKECGAFDPRYFLYYEETDLQRAFQTRGYKNYIINGPRIIHFGGKSKVDSDWLLKAAEPMKSEIIYMKKWHPLLPYLVYRIAIFVLRLPYLFRARYSRAAKMKYFRILLSRAYC